METKKMTFAGSWYPADSSECEASIQGFLKETPGPLEGEFSGGIVPHAGWYYSGSIACRVIAALKSEDKIDTVFLFGSHMHPQSEPFILGEGSVETPFGNLLVDDELVENICAVTNIRKRSPVNFPDENTLELQYPFIKYFYPNAKMVVCGVPPTSFASLIGSKAVEEAGKLSRIIRIIGSTDMTHYGPDFGFTSAGMGKKALEWVKTKNDQDAIKSLVEMDEAKIIAQGLQNKNMCCPGAAAAAAAACKKLGAVKAVELDYATSFDKSASSSFVGYAGVLYALS